MTAPVAVFCCLLRSAALQSDNDSAKVPYVEPHIHASIEQIFEALVINKGLGQDGANRKAARTARPSVLNILPTRLQKRFFSLGLGA